MSEKRHPYIRIRLRLKITAMVLFIVVMIMGTVSYYNLRLDIRARQYEIEDRMQQIVKAIANVGNSRETRGNWQILKEYIDNIKLALENIVYVAVFDDKGHLTVAYTLNEEQTVIKMPSHYAVTDSLIREYVLRLDSSQTNPSISRDLGFVSEDIRYRGEFDGQVKMGYSKVDLNKQLNYAFKRTVVLFVIFILLGLGASLILSARLTKPLSLLSAAMETVPEGKLTEVPVHHSSDEIGTLANSFNYMIKELREKEFLDQFERDLGKVFTLDTICITLLDRLNHLYGIDRGVFFIKQGAQTYNEVYRSNLEIVFPATIHTELEESLRQYLAHDEVFFSREQLLSITQNNPAVQEGVSLFRQNSIHWVIFVRRSERSASGGKDSTFGVIYLGSDAVHVSTDKEQKKSIINLIHHTLFPFELALLHIDLTERERFKKELEIAWNIQAQLLPQTMPSIPGYDIFGLCVPAREIGGDYFDYVPIDAHRLGIVIADVAGKSTSAAFYMAEIKGMIVSLGPLYESPKELLKVMNMRMFPHVDRSIFASMIYGILNIDTNEFVFARAGHNPLLIKRASSMLIEEYIPEGLGLGLDRGEKFNSLITEHRLSLQAGDTILLYTDGVIDSMNRKNEEFSEERLKFVWLNYDNHSASETCTHILQEIRKFSQDCEQWDDITMVMIRKM